MGYKDLNDDELLYMINESDEDSYDLLCSKYKNLVSSMAYKYYNKHNNIGIDINDLIMEGNMGLDIAIKNYNSCNKEDARFSTFAYICIERQILRLIRNATTKKNQVLNNSIYGVETDIQNIQDSNYDTHPLNKLLLKENIQNKYIETIKNLTSLEQKVFMLKNLGYSNNELEYLLEVNHKCILNTIYRIRKKIKEIQPI